MDVTTISMTEEDAEQKYQEYLEVVKTHKEKYLEDLKKVYKALSDGKKVIDIYKAFKDTGVNEEGDPKLAISVADGRSVFFFKEAGGGGLFSGNDGRSELVADVRLPGDTFPRWKMMKGTESWNSDRRIIRRRKITTKVPLVPAYLMPNGGLSNYYLLWEVDEWKEEDAPIAAKDPFLLRRINANTFIVFAAWDLTEVEQIVMRGV